MVAEVDEWGTTPSTSICRTGECLKLPVRCNSADRNLALHETLTERHPGIQDDPSIGLSAVFPGNHLRYRRSMHS